MGTAAPRDVYRNFAPFYDHYVAGFYDDLLFYLDQAHRLRRAHRLRMPLIEIGAGSGRLTIPLARAGHQVVAVDVSGAMLAKLRARRALQGKHVKRRLRLVRCDAAEMSLGFASDLIIVPYYTFNYFVSARVRDALLRRIRAHLTEDGRALIDVFIPLARIARCPPEPVLKVQSLWPGGYVRGWNRYRIDVRRQLETRDHVFAMEGHDGQVRYRRFTTQRRYWHAAQLRALFRRHGFRVEAVYRGYDEQPAKGDAEQLLWVLRRR